MSTDQYVEQSSIPHAHANDVRREANANILGDDRPVRQAIAPSSLTGQSLEIEGVAMHSVTLGALTLRSAMAINGGGAVAILLLIGLFAVTDFSGESIAPLATSLVNFSGGVLCTAIAFGSAYLNQYLNGARGDKVPWLAGIFRLATVALILGSYGAFVLGIGAAYSGLASYSAAIRQNDRSTTPFAAQYASVDRAKSIAPGQKLWHRNVVNVISITTF